MSITNTSNTRSAIGIIIRFLARLEYDRVLALKSQRSKIDSIVVVCACAIIIFY